MNAPLALKGSAGRRRAAIAVVALGAERAAVIMGGMDDEAVRALAIEISELGPVSTDEVRAAMKELAKAAGGNTTLAAPGPKFTRDLLVRALGPDRGAMMADEVDVPGPFSWLADADPDAVVPALAMEPAGAVALALAHLDAGVAARLLTRLPDLARTEVAVRIAGLGVVHPETVLEVEATLRERLSGLLSSEVTRIAGPQLLAGMLAKAGKDAERALLAVLSSADPELAEATRAALFTFDDITAMDNKSLQVVLKNVETRELATALVGIDDSLRDRILGNMSERARETLVEEIDLLHGTKAKDVSAARTAIVASARQLEAEGVLVLSREGEQ
ncbi:MAG: hypothetical protein H7269_15260 [Cellulomonas sp.]|nr:hypothetical protein [Cellulomonas sp.]